MEVSRSTEVKVGLLIGAGLALFMITTLLLGGGKKFFTSIYTLKVRFDSVAGIAPGSVIQLLGIPVGNVKRITFVPNTALLEVDLEVEKEFQHRITEGSVAGVRTQGALGDKYIFITPGPDTASVLPEGSLLRSEEGGDFFSSLSKRGDDIQRLFDAVAEAHKLLANLNADGKSAQLMPNLVKSTDELHKMLANLNLVLQDVRANGGEGGLKSSLAHLDSVLRKVDRGQGTLGALINDPEIHERIKSALGGSSHNSFMKNQVRETIKTER
jgi:phospholipid/cholesterol/gamma-HCH transport system substrate-binding protein